MKKLISIMAATSVLLPAGTASAATKCVALNSNSILMCQAVDPGFYAVDWTATCITSSTSVPISGIAICAGTSGSEIGATTDSLTIANDEVSNTYCWCKMTSPAVSGWVLGITSNEACMFDCAHQCSTSARSNSAFRSALFSNLSD